MCVTDVILTSSACDRSSHVWGCVGDTTAVLMFQFLKKLNRQERVVEEVKLVLKPHYNKKHVTKDEYKDILRRAVPKVLVLILRSPPCETNSLCYRTSCGCPLGCCAT